ncbi:probable BOI-related E3 ubiquitin-protein ligase 2 [Hibiscus syriacus]|uniref:probable BOI-related E3 ubiquitin-protein ligase 2 n=1 Tax=Hibiscus syriacus TaxID=106335 RepID=UPI0019228382|nr:probable BOI-related E3 ubiquitin-protein ligase 2 [Hibiscus syriacus]
MAAQTQFCYENPGSPLPILPSSETGFCLQELPFQQNASMAVSQPLDVQLEIQRRELDFFLQLHNERLSSLLQSIETKALYLMRQREEDLARARKKRMEVEERLRRVEMENRSWQRLAEANESMVMDLSKRLAMERCSAEDEGSIFRGSCNKDQQQEERDNKMACKHCNSRGSCVVFLPCRHLCSCISCEPLLVSCHVCKSVKEGSIRAFWV